MLNFYVASSPEGLVIEIYNAQMMFGGSMKETSERISITRAMSSEEEIDEEIKYLKELLDSASESAKKKLKHRT